MNNFLKDYLNCPCCGFILNDPRLLPCGHTYCHDCVFMFQSQIRCILCLENKSEHMEGNFPPNRLVAKMIQDTSNGLNRISNKHIDKLTEHIQSIEFELIELERIHKTPIEKIANYCKQLRNEIALSHEKQIIALKKYRDDLFFQIDEYENECGLVIQTKQRNLEKNLKLVTEIKDYLYEWSNQIYQSKFEQNETEKAIVESNIKLDQLKKVNEEMKTLVFDRTESNDFDRELANIEISLLEILDQKVSKSLQSTETIRVFDQLELKKFQKVYIYDKIKENVKITSINCLENGEYVISGTKGNNLLCLYVIDHHKCLASWREQLNRPFRHIMSCSLNSIIIKVYDHINFDTSIIVFDKRLKKQTSKVMAQTSCWLTSDDRFVYLLQLRPNIIIHFLTHQLDFHQDLRLNFEKKDFSIDDFFVNIKTYYLLDQHNGSILVGDMKTGNLVRKIRIEGAKIFTRSLISIQNELVVVILQFFEKIEKQYLAVIDIKKGEIVEKIELDFEKKVQQIVLKNKQFFSFIDLNRYIIYVAIEN